MQVYEKLNRVSLLTKFYCNVASATFTFFTSLPGRIKTKKLSEFHQISKLWDFRPQERLT